MHGQTHLKFTGFSMLLRVKRTLTDFLFGIQTSLRAGNLTNPASISCRDYRFYSSPRRPDRLWAPITFLSGWYGRLFQLW